MRNKIAVCLVAVVIQFTSAVSYAFQDGDFQVWHTENQDVKFYKDAKLTVEEEFRWGDGASDFYYHHYDFGLAYSANKNIDLGVNYRQVYDKKGNKFLEENRPHINITLKSDDLYGFKLEDRNRFEYRHFRYQSDFCRYRNKFTVKYPVTVCKVNLEPYVADEVFVDLKDKGGLSRNRFYAGLGVNLTKNVKAEAYYLLQSTKSSNVWTDANVLGTKLKIAF